MLLVYNLNLLYMDPVICIFIQQFKLYYALLMVWITCFNYFCFFLTKNNTIYFFITNISILMLLQTIYLLFISNCKTIFFQTLLCTFNGLDYMF